ncbi:MAG TPA: EamA family transporter [Clostridia bacterium]|nr:EamA family transporter [Clostridia bacterium]
MYYIAILLVIVSNVIYHIIQKITPSKINPFLILLITYSVAAIVCGVIFVLFPGDGGIPGAVKKVSWTSVALGLAIIGLELGFLLAYRAGWNISVAALLANAAVGILLVVVGVLFFRDKLSPSNILGIVLTITGLILINKK